MIGDDARREIAADGIGVAGGGIDVQDGVGHGVVSLACVVIGDKIGLCHCERNDRYETGYVDIRT